MSRHSESQANQELKQTRDNNVAIGNAIHGREWPRPDTRRVNPVTCVKLMLGLLVIIFIEPIVDGLLSLMLTVI